MTTLIGRRCTHGNVFSRPVLIGRGLGEPFCSRSLWNAQGVAERPLRDEAIASSVSTISGDHGGGDTPVPIPNTAVKPASADGTWGATPWESRTSPGFLSNEAPCHLARGFVYFVTPRDSVMTMRNRPTDPWLAQS